MENKRGNIDLLKFNGARKVKLKDEMGIFIPVVKESGSPMNPAIYVNEKSARVSVRIREHENSFTDKNGKEHISTHFVALSVPKSIRDAYDKDKEAMKAFTPIVGNLEDDSFDSQTPTYEVEQEAPARPAAAPYGGYQAPAYGKPEDLPWI